MLKSFKYTLCNLNTKDFKKRYIIYINTPKFIYYLVDMDINVGYTHIYIYTCEELQPSTNTEQ